MLTHGNGQHNEFHVNTLFRMCTTIADIVKTTLGPHGLHTMVVRSSGTPVIAKNGITIVEELNIEHPVYDIIENIVEEQKKQISDPTKSLILLSKLIENAKELLEQGVHPTSIIGGYCEAQRKSIHEIESIAIEGDSHKEYLHDIVKFQLDTMVNEYADYISTLLIDSIFEESSDEIHNVDTIYIHEIPGRSVHDSFTIPGVCAEKRRPANSAMPLPITDTPVLLLTDSLQSEEYQHGVNIPIEDDTQGSHLTDFELARKRSIAKDIASLGCPVVFVEQMDNIDDKIQQFLADNDVTAFHQIDHNIMDALSCITGATKVSNINDIEETDLGYASRVGRKYIGDEKKVFVENETGNVGTTIVLRGGSETVVEEMSDAIEQCIQTVKIIREDNRVLPKGGAPEMHLATILNEHAATFGNREQLAIQAYADALEAIPSVLAENAGMDPTDAKIKLRNKHEQGIDATGIDPYNKEIANMLDHRRVEPFQSVSQPIEVATDVATTLLRIDDIFKKIDSE